MGAQRGTNHTHGSRLTRRYRQVAPVAYRCRNEEGVVICDRASEHPTGRPSAQLMYSFCHTESNPRTDSISPAARQSSMSLHTARTVSQQESLDDNPQWS